MQGGQAYEFNFTVAGEPEDTFAVVSFTGKEFVSRPYRFEIVLAASDPNLDPADFVFKDCRLTINGQKTSRRFSGIVYLFRHIRRAGKKYIYQIVLMPRLQRLSLYTRSRVFLQQSCLTFIKNILKDAAIPYEIRMPGNQAYPAREYTCQFNESDFDFVSRWLEDQGISYFFEERKGDTPEVMVLAVAKDAQKPCRSGNTPMTYSPPSGVDHTHREDVVQTFVSEHGCVPKHVFLKDYTYEGQPYMPTASQEVDSDVAQGVVWQYGSTFLSEQYGVQQQTILAQQVESTETAYQGESFCPEVSAGHTLELQDHYRASYNGDFYVYLVKHEGSDKKHVLPDGRHGRDDPRGPDSELDHESAARQMYANTFYSIPADCNFRPRKRTPVPSFTGMLTAFVEDGKGQESQGKYAPVNPQGRYQIRLPFDLWQPESNKEKGYPEHKGKVSHWIRLAEPYAGNGAGKEAFGMHFPLLKGTEVLLSFVEGDIDRPVIICAVYNERNTNPVTRKNSSFHVLRTKAGCSIEIDDTEGKESIAMACPGKETLVVYNPEGITVSTKKNAVTANWSDSLDFKGGSSVSISAGSNTSAFAGTKASLTIGSNSSITVGTSLSADFGGKVAFGGMRSLINSDFKATSEDSMSLQSGMNMVLKEYYKTVKAAMIAGALCSLPTGLGSWAAVAGATGQNKDINDTAAVIAGSVVGGLGLMGQIIGNTLGVAAYLKLQSKKKAALYTTTMDMGHDGADLTVRSAAGSTAACEFQVVEPALNASSSIKLGAQGKEILLTNKKDAMLQMLNGEEISLAIANAPSMLPIYSILALTKNKGAELTVKNTGSLGIDTQSVTLEHFAGGKITLDTQGVALKSDESNFINIKPTGIQLKCTAPANIASSSALKLNSDGMVMIG